MTVVQLAAILFILSFVGPEGALPARPADAVRAPLPSPARRARPSATHDRGASTRPAGARGGDPPAPPPGASPGPAAAAHPDGRQAPASSQYELLLSAITAAGGSTQSALFSAELTVGEIASGDASSPHYRSGSGFV